MSVVSPDVFSESIGLSDNEEVASPMLSADETFEEPEEHDENDVTAPWVEVAIHHKLTEEEAQDYSFFMEIDSESRGSIVIGDELADSRMSDGSVSNIFDNMLRTSSDFNSPDSLPLLDCDDLRFLDQYSDEAIEQDEDSSSSFDQDSDDLTPSRNISPLMKENRKRGQRAIEFMAKRIKLEEPDEYEDDKENVEEKLNMYPALKTSEEIAEVIKKIKTEEPDDYEYAGAMTVVKEEPTRCEEVEV